MSREWPFLRRGDENGKRVRLHESQSDGAIFYAVEFGDVHSNSDAATGSRLLRQGGSLAINLVQYFHAAASQKIITHRFSQF
jgi:hypothetical protein